MFWISEITFLTSKNIILTSRNTYLIVEVVIKDRSLRNLNSKMGCHTARGYLATVPHSKVKHIVRSSVGLKVLRIPSWRWVWLQETFVIPSYSIKSLEIEKPKVFATIYCHCQVLLAVIYFPFSCPIVTQVSNHSYINLLVLSYWIRWKEKILFIYLFLPVCCNLMYRVRFQETEHSFSFVEDCARSGQQSGLWLKNTLFH